MLVVVVWGGGNGACVGRVVASCCFWYEFQGLRIVARLEPNSPLRGLRV